MKFVFNKTLLMTAGLLLVAVVSWVLHIQFGSIGDIDIESEEHHPDYYMKDFSASGMDELGNLKHKFSADVLTHYPNDDSVLLEQLNLVMFNNEEKSWNVSAERARAEEDSQIVYLEGNVKLVKDRIGRSPLVVSTDKLTLELNKKLASTQSDVQIADEKMLTRATGMEVDLLKNSLNLLSDVNGVYFAPEK